MTIGSLYSGGIDAFSYAANYLGIHVKWHVENDSRAYPYLRKNYPNTKIYTHDTFVGKHNLEWVNIISGGDPCQPHSYSGLRRGKTDNRYRWPEMFRIITELRPDWVINENVVGSISNMVLDQKISDLEKIGYSWGAYNIPAVSVGAHHERQRIFIVAYSNEKRWPELLHFDTSAIFKEVKNAITLGASGNAFLQFEQSQAEPALFPMAYGIPDHVFRLEAAGNSIVAPIPIILLKAIIEIDKLL